MSRVLEGMDGITPADVAERWYARLMAPDCSMREREQFEHWLRQSPENALAFEDTKALWASLGELDQDEGIGPHTVSALEPEAGTSMDQWIAAADHVRRPRTRHSSRRWLTATAGIAATLVVAVLVWVRLPPAVPDVPYLATNKIESLRLNDGSEVQLDLDTRMTAKIGPAIRKITLSQGRAMFEVAKDARRPFVVDAGVGVVTALGTRFEVQREEEAVSVTLLEGVVGIGATDRSDDRRMLRLAPGQRATYAAQTRSWTVEATDAEALTSWSEGFHVFGATPLTQAILEINRYSSMKLVLADPSLGDLVVSGSFKLGDGKAVSEALPYALPVTASQKEGHIVISRK